MFEVVKVMMKKIKKDNKALQPRMNPMEERGQINGLYDEAVPVWYSRNGKVNPEWLSACREQRNAGEAFNGTNSRPIKFK